MVQTSTVTTVDAWLTDPWVFWLFAFVIPAIVALLMRWQRQRQADAKNDGHTHVETRWCRIHPGVRHLQLAMCPYDRITLHHERDVLHCAQCGRGLKLGTLRRLPPDWRCVEYVSHSP